MAEEQAAEAAPPAAEPVPFTPPPAPESVMGDAVLDRGSIDELLKQSELP